MHFHVEGLTWQRMFSAHYPCSALLGPRPSPECSSVATGRTADSMFRRMLRFETRNETNIELRLFLCNVSSTQRKSTT